jgi:hypothetical protein
MKGVPSTASGFSEEVEELIKEDVVRTRSRRKANRKAARARKRLLGGIVAALLSRILAKLEDHIFAVVWTFCAGVVSAVMVWLFFTVSVSSDIRVSRVKLSAAVRVFPTANPKCDPTCTRC